jgi:HAD superfamily hydrolase (TIGR01450 family)
MPVPIRVPDLVSSYEVILLDAYGVLVNEEGALPMGRLLLDEIARQGRRFFVVTNDASRLPETWERRFASMGLDIGADAILTSGALLAPYFAAHGLEGARCMVLGPEDSRTYVTQAGGRVVPVRGDDPCDVLVIGDDAGYPFLETVEEALGMLYRHFDEDRSVTLLLPNPDLIYPKGNGRYGFTSGGVALLLEAGLGRRYPRRELRFTPLGKPHRPMFDEARRRAGTDKLVMVGDQLETDIAGARAVGIDTVLVDTGVTLRTHSDDPVRPLYVLQ